MGTASRQVEAMEIPRWAVGLIIAVALIVGVIGLLGFANANAVLRSGETSFEYERLVQPRPKLGRWASELAELLSANAAKSAREQLTLIRIFEELRGRGYDGGYDAVRRYARRWSKERGQSTAAAYVPLSFAPGEAYQFEWSHEVVLLHGVTGIVKAAHVRLCHSRMLFVRCSPRETQEMVFDAHDRAFALKGTCSRGIYDNM